MTLQKANHTLLFLGLAILASIGFSACGGNSNYVEEQKVELTKGLITEIQEVDSNEFKITNETVVPNKADSRIIATYLDGTVDTLTVDQVAKTENSSTTRHYYRRSGMSSVLMGGLMGYYMGRSFSSPPRASAYADPQTYNRVTSNAGTTLNNTARRTTVRRPSRSSSGYGSGRSTRSYGG
ncbi:MAG: hypothetical protein MRY78_01340 [Saprospiraceae bacterium]|nr:hypothetical protein [Saprospiraceae bacterium]